MARQKSERFEMRLSPDEKETLQKAVELIGSGDVAGFVRESALLIAQNIIDIHEGTAHEVLTVVRYQALLRHFVSYALLRESGKLQKSAGYTYETVIRDLEGNELERFGSSPSE